MFSRALLLLAASLTLSHAEKPTIYNPLNGEDTPQGKAAVATLVPIYSIVEIPKNSDFTPPKFIAGKIGGARTPDGNFLGGEVSAGFVITDQGLATDVTILKSSDERLNAFALDAAKTWRFTPATYKGKPISIVGDTDLSFPTPPTEFVTQILEPTGGKIERPKDWFYTEGASSNSYLWTISKEDLAKENRYLTGVRIQLITGIKEKTGKSPEQFIQDFIENKKQQADQVLESCEPKDQGLFTRICLQTEEGPFRILYSLFWGNDDLDMAVVTTAGTPKALWEIYASTFDRMSAFEIIDMKHIERNQANNREETDEAK